MAHKPVNRIAKALRNPSTSEINRKRKAINTNWTPEERNRRQRNSRGTSDQLFEAHVRFLRFLVEQVQ